LFEKHAEKFLSAVAMGATSTLAIPAGFEPATLCLEGKRVASNFKLRAKLAVGIR
jgi:hypothetical protein